MVVLTKQQKDLISYLLTLKRDANNVVYIARNTYHYTLSEKDLLCELNFLADEGYIEIHTLTKNQKNLDVYIGVHLLSPTLNYKETNTAKRRMNTYKFVTDFLPIFLSAGSFIVALIALLSK